MKKSIITATAVIALSGCALGTPPVDIKPANVDASQYSVMSCDQMQDEYNALIIDKKHYIGEQKDRRALNHTMALWIAGFGIGDGEAADNLAHTKGELVALETAAGNSGCELEK